MTPRTTSSNAAVILSPLIQSIDLISLCRSLKIDVRVDRGGRIKGENWGQLPQSERERVKALEPHIVALLLHETADGASLPCSPVEARAEWDLWRACQERVLGHVAHELTDADIQRIVDLEARIEACVATCARVADYRILRAIIEEWQRATTPLRWLAHGTWYESGAWYDDQVQTYRDEARWRGVPDAALCGGREHRGHGGHWCGGACRPTRRPRQQATTMAATTTTAEAAA